MPQLLDPNWPIYASQRAVRYYWPCKKRHLAELTSRFDTSRKHDWTNEDVQFIMDFFVVERFKKKKDVRFLWRFYLSFFLFFFFHGWITSSFRVTLFQTRGRRFEIPPVSASSFICQRDSDCYTWADCTPIGTASLCIC